MFEFFQLMNTTDVQPPAPLHTHTHSSDKTSARAAWLCATQSKALHVFCWPMTPFFFSSSAYVYTPSSSPIARNLQTTKKNLVTRQWSTNIHKYIHMHIVLSLYIHIVTGIFYVSSSLIQLALFLLYFDISGWFFFGIATISTLTGYDTENQFWTSWDLYRLIWHFSCSC